MTLHAASAPAALSLPIAPFTTPPDDATLTWGNQGSATATEGDRSLLMSVVNGSSEVLRTLHKATPGTPWALTVAFQFIAGALTTSAYCGLVFRESAGGTTHAFRYQNDGAYGSVKHDAAGAGLAFYSGFPTTAVVVPYVCHWMRIEDNGTNRICSLSPDGVEFWTFHSIGRTDYLTANQAGICIGGNNSARVAMRVLSWSGI